MKLYRNLGYALLAVFIAGIVWVCLADPASVASRIAAGLITGSFVGVVNTFVNYMHSRASFFEKMTSVLTEISFELGHDYIVAKILNEDLASSPREQIIDRYKNRFHEEKEEVEDMEKRYALLVDKIDSESFAGIPPIDNKVKKDLDDLDDLLFKVRYLHGIFMGCRCFSLLSSKAPKEVQEIVIGNPDEFYDELVESNKEFQDIVASYMKELGDLGVRLSDSMKGTVPAEKRKFLSALKFAYSSYVEDNKSRSFLKREEDPSQTDPS